MTDIPVCGECGQQHVISAGPQTLRGAPACIRHVGIGPKDGPINPRAGGPCGQPPMRGQKVCRFHGGSSPQALARAERDLAAQAVDTDMRKTIRSIVGDEPEPVRDPIAVLARLAGEADQVRAIAADKIDRIAVGGADDLPRLAALLTWYERWFDRTAKTCEALVRSNYIERHAALEEADAVRILGKVQRGLNVIPDAELRRTVANEIATGLRELQQPA